MHILQYLPKNYLLPFFCVMHLSYMHTPFIGMHIWPTVADLNTRARRLVTHFLKCQKQEEQRQAKLQRIKEKKEREKEVSRKKMLKRMEQAEKWSKREEQDFSRVISFYGVERNLETSEYDWSKFRLVYI